MDCFIFTVVIQHCLLPCTLQGFAVSRVIVVICKPNAEKWERLREMGWGAIFLFTYFANHYELSVFRSVQDIIWTSGCLVFSHPRNEWICMYCMYSLSQVLKIPVAFLKYYFLQILSMWMSQVKDMPVQEDAMQHSGFLYTIPHAECHKRVHRDRNLIRYRARCSNSQNGRKRKWHMEM